MGFVAKAVGKLFGGGSRRASEIVTPPPVAVQAPVVDQSINEQAGLQNPNEMTKKNRRGKSSLIISSTGLNTGGNGGLNV